MSLKGIKGKLKTLFEMKFKNKIDINEKKLNESNFDFKGIKKINVPNNRANKPFLEDVNSIPIITKKIRNKLVIFFKSKPLFLKKVAYKNGQIVARAQAV